MTAATLAQAIRDAALAQARDVRDLEQRKAPHKAMLAEIDGSELGQRVKARAETLERARTLWASEYAKEAEAVAAARLAGTETPDPMMPTGTTLQRRTEVTVADPTALPRSMLTPDMKAIKAAPVGSVPGTGTRLKYILVCNGEKKP